MNKELVESIYPETLYALEEPLTIVIDRPWEDLTLAEVELLSKILESIKQGLTKVKIINHAAMPISQLNAKRTILFGARATPEITYYELVQMDDKLIIQADAIKFLDDSKKKSLWAAIRKLY